MAAILWKSISRSHMTRKQKQRFFLIFNTINHAIAGYILWLIFERYITNNRPEWLISFVGYPAVFGGFLLGIFYLFKKDQQDTYH